MCHYTVNRKSTMKSGERQSHMLFNCESDETRTDCCAGLPTDERRAQAVSPRGSSIGRWTSRSMACVMVVGRLIVVVARAAAESDVDQADLAQRQPPATR